MVWSFRFNFIQLFFKISDAKKVEVKKTDTEIEIVEVNRVSPTDNCAQAKDVETYPRKVRQKRKADTSDPEISRQPYKFRKT